jgi:hypothetical protein
MACEGTTRLQRLLRLLVFLVHSRIDIARFGTIFFVILSQSGILTSLRELSFFDTLPNIPEDEGTASVHARKRASAMVVVLATI